MAARASRLLHVSTAAACLPACQLRPLLLAVVVVLLLLLPLLLLLLSTPCRTAAAAALTSERRVLLHQSILNVFRACQQGVEQHAVPARCTGSADRQGSI
jgi:cell division protein FtsX